MPGWFRSAASGPRTWMPWNAISTAWISQHQPKGTREKAVAQTANVTKEKRNEDQSAQPVRGRPGEGLALLYRGAGLREEARLQQRAVPLADRGLGRGAGRHGAATGAQ